MFPFAYRAQLRRSKASIPDVQNFIRDFQFRATCVLDHYNARNIRTKSGRLFFTAGAFRLVTNWNLLNSIGYGYIDINETESEFVISYYLSFVQMQLITAIALSVFLMVILFQGGLEPSVGINLVFIFGLLWLVLAVIQWLGGFIHFRPLVKSMIWGERRPEQSSST